MSFNSSRDQPSQQLSNKSEADTLHFSRIRVTTCTHNVSVMIESPAPVRSLENYYSYVGGRPILPQGDILTSLQSTPLFSGVHERWLKEFTKYCSFEEFGVGDKIPVRGRAQDEIPIFLVTKGCVALHATTGYGRYEKIILALVMPAQLLYEFQFLGDPLPANSGAVAVDETRVVVFYPNRFEELLRHQPVVMRNLARTIMVKQNISNFHLEAVCQTKGDLKIATMLSGFIRLAAWRPNGYDDPHLKKEMPLSVVWSIDLLTGYLSCDVRTARNGLLELIKTGLIKVQWLNDELMPLEGIGEQDLKAQGRKGGMFHEKTAFRISILKPGKLEEYCGNF